MIEEIGKVVEYKNGIAKINIDSKLSCHSCKMCKKGNKEMFMEVATDLPLSSGRPVRLKIKGRNLLLVSFVLYIVPILDFIIGVIIGMYLARFLSYEKYEQEFELVFGILFFCTSFFLARWLDRKMQ